MLDFSDIVISALIFATTYLADKAADKASDKAVEDAYNIVKKTIRKRIGKNKDIDKEFNHKGTRNDDWVTLREEIRAVSTDLEEIRKAVQTLVMLVHERSSAPFLVPSAPSYDLIGRDNLLFKVKQNLFSGKNVVLFGLPGVGKTAIALELVHDPDVLAHFRDGILWAGLGRGADPFPHLGRWAVALGIQQDEINNAITAEERKLFINSTIKDRRLLLVVDDAWDCKAEKALRVGGSNCVHLVTTRILDIQVDFPVEGCMHICELREEDGLELLKTFVPDVVKSEPKKTKELIEAVGGLPLAVMMMGRYLKIEILRGMLNPLDKILGRLHESMEQSLLEQLRDHPGLQGVPSLVRVIGISDEALDEASQRTLRALSVFPPKPNTFSVETALAVSAESEEALSTLIRYGLVESIKNSEKPSEDSRRLPEDSKKSSEGENEFRLTLHQTIADYARINRTDEESCRRMADFFITYIQTYRKDFEALERENDNIFAAFRIAHDMGMKKEFVEGVNAVLYFLKSRGLYNAAKIHLDRAQEAARYLGDTRGLMTTLFNLGQVADAVENFRLAEEYFKEGLSLAFDVNNTYKIIDFYRNLGIVASKRGKYLEAEDYLKKGLDRANQINDKWRICGFLQSLGILASQRGYYTQAEEYFQEGLNLISKTGNKGKISSFYVSLGILAGQCGDFVKAEKHLEKGLSLARETEDLMRITSALVAKGIQANQCGKFAEAEKHFNEGLSLARETKYNGKISAFLVSFGFMEFIRGNYTKAEEYLQEGLGIAKSMGYNDRVSALLAYLGALETKRGKDIQAKKHLLEGLDVVCKIDNPEKKSIVLENLGVFECDHGTLRQARKYLLRGLKLAYKIKNPERISSLHKSLGALEIKHGRFEKAEKHLRRGQDLACKIQHQWRICEIYNEWGEYYLRQEKWRESSDNFTKSLKETQKMGTQELNATALYGLARAAAAQGKVDEARYRGEESFRIFKNIGHKKADDVGQFLTILK